MELFTKKHELKISYRRFTPQKEIFNDDYGMNFSFADWRKKNKFKSSPLTPDIKRDQEIKECYIKEQKKIIIIHKSFDHRGRKESKIEGINIFINRLITENGMLKKKLA